MRIRYAFHIPGGTIPYNTEASLELLGSGTVGASNLHVCHCTQHIIFLTFCSVLFETRTHQAQYCTISSILDHEHFSSNEDLNSQYFGF